jgi:uroporphyrinogen-III synthase
MAAEALPLIEIAPASAAADVQALRQAWQTLDRYAACMFVSGNAVEHFFKENKAPAQEERDQEAINTIANHAPNRLPPALRFMAPGPGTVAALRAAGVPAGQIDAPALDASQFDSEALWQVVGQRDWQGRRVLVVRGQSLAADGEGAGSPGRDWLARQWQAAGAQVDFVAVYQRRAPLLAEAQVQRAKAASTDGSVWLFSSSEAVANLASQPHLSRLDWRRARAVATHPRIADTLRAAGWGVVVESRPALKDIKAVVRSIESHYP